MSATDPLHTAWFTKAANDFLTIRKVMVGDDVPWDVVTFHAQQGAETQLQAIAAFGQ